MRRAARFLLGRFPRVPSAAPPPRAPDRVRVVVLAVALFRLLTRLMPRRYRERHRDEAVALMARLADDAYRRAGALGVVGVAGRAVLDLIVRLPAEHAAALRRPRRARQGGARAGALRTGDVGERLRASLEALRRDVWDAVRSLRRRPVSSGAAVATLAIGIGLNAAVFSVVDWVLLRPLPYPAPRELVRVSTAGAGGAPVTDPTELTWSEVTTFSRATAFRASTAFSTAVRVIVGPGIEPAHVVVARVGGDLFGTFGVYPAIGRGFDRREAGTGAAVIVISHALWRHRFDGDRAIVGRIVSIDGRPHTIVGVMPAGRGYPVDADLWRPLTTEEREDDDRENVMIARLMPGVSTDRASQEVAALAAGGGTAAGERAGPGAAHAASSVAADSGTRVDGMTAGTPARGRPAWVEDVQRTEVRDVRATLTALWASAALILLMTCANVAALIGARGADRAGEMAVRGALGAGRGRLLRQLLTESVLLAFAGGLAGLLLGHWTLDLLVRVAPIEVPRLAEIALDGRVIVISMAATLIVGVVVGLAPSWRASRLDLRSSLGGAASSRASRRTSGRRLLVAAQTAIAVVLTVGAGLLARSLQHLVAIDHGFQPDRLLAIDLYVRGDVVPDVPRLFRDLVEHAQAVHGVRSAAIAGRLPTQLTGLRVPVRVDGLMTTPRGASAGAGARVEAPTATLRPITSTYFDTTGIPLIDGRAFTSRDSRTAPAVAIVNAGFVRDILRGGPAIGARVTVERVESRVSIVGVAADVTPAGETDRPALYVPIDQLSLGGGWLLVRTDRDPSLVVPALTARLRGVAPTLALDRIRDVAATIDAGRAVTRFSMQLASAFAGLALLLAAIGLYGLTAGEVSVRWRELAVRLALGATRGEALWTAMRPGAAALAAGIVSGLAATPIAGRWMASLLHGIAPADPPTLLIVPLILAAIGVAATALAAARILSADPAATLRRE